MNPRTITNEVTPYRLTWDSRGPAPLESAWSIFNKIQRLNAISLNKLVNLVRRYDRYHPRSTNQIFKCGDWVDFALLAGLLGIEERRLREGFVEQIGFPSNSEGEYRPRICQMCLEMDYHSTMFDVAAVEYCAWHAVPLKILRRSSWGGDYSYTQELAENNFHVNLGKFGAIKAHAKNDVLSYTGLPQESIIRREFNVIHEWWEGVTMSLPNRDNIFFDIATAGKSAMQSSYNRSWQLSYLAKLSSLPAALGGKNIKPGIDLMVIENVQSERSTIGKKTAISSSLGKMYRCVRRQVEKVFLRCHMKCLSKLKNLPRSQHLNLEPNQICPIALAYLIWRMSVEGICHVDGLRHPRKNGFEIKLMTPGFHINVPAKGLCLWTYLSFFGICKELETRLAEGGFYVELSETFPCNGFLVWKNVFDDRLNLRERSFGNTSRIYLFYPNRQATLTNGILRCPRMQGSKNVRQDFVARELCSLAIPVPRTIFNVRRTESNRSEIKCLFV